ncbi:hypothetical protein LzC2_17650 [Planctomycetes bacterium LzC2]|uniref:PAS domain S-box protein n=2 Tax=Alienimonas chondri TaxID=2681879 RepID=A0ABX1VC54_9PLAN|nr:hypothetical protein [Alienimonas chondri]
MDFAQRPDSHSGSASGGPPPDAFSLSTALQDSGCGVFWLDENLLINRTNAAFARFCGRSVEALIGTKIAEIDVDWPHGSKQEAFDELRSKTSVGHAARLKRPDGALYPVQFHLNFLNVCGLESLFGVALDTSDRQAAEDETRRSEARYRAVTEDQTEFIVRTNSDCRITFCNPAYARLVGVGSPEELIGQPGRDLVRPEDLDRICGTMRMLSSENMVVHIENLVPTPDGKEVWVYWIVRALFDVDANGERHIREYQSVGRDVSERRAAREALARTEARYRSLVEDSPELVCRWTPDGTFTFANRTCCRFFGLSDGAENRTLRTIWDSETCREVDRVKRGFTPENSLARLVMAGRRHDGALRQLEWVFRGFFDRAGILTEVQSVGRDVTERFEAETCLAESERRHRNVLDDLSEMVNRFRPHDGLITYANRAFLEAKGGGAEKVVGKMTIYDHLSREAEQWARSQLAAVTPENPSVQALLPLPGPGGTTRWEEWTNRALFAPPDPGAPGAPREVLEFQSVGRDVSVELAARNRRIEREEAAAQLAKLTPRERQVLSVVTTGVTNKVIAKDLGITERTVEKHRGSAMRKLGVRSVAELIRAAIAAEEDVEAPVAGPEIGREAIGRTG